MEQTRQEQLEELIRKRESATDEKEMWGVAKRITRLKHLMIEEGKLEQYSQRAEKLGYELEARDRLWRVTNSRGIALVQYWPSTRRYHFKGRREYGTASNFGTLLSILEGKNPYAKTRLNFGKHAGERIEDVPVEYLAWLRDNAELYGNIKTALDFMFQPYVIDPNRS